MTEPETSGSAIEEELRKLHARVSELEALEEEVRRLRASEAELGAMFRAIPDVVLVMDRDGRYLKIPRTSTDKLYRPSQELLGRSVRDIMPEAEAQFFVSKFREAIDTNAVVTMEYSLPIGERLVAFHASISPLSDGTVFVIARDVTMLQQAAEALRRQTAQEEIIRVQDEALAALSTPIVPISDEIFVMSLVGKLDGRRIERVMSAVLETVHQQSARAVIVDITGVPTVDEEVAAALVAVARAVGLLGARAILTGIRPDVARTLCVLGSDLGGIATRSTLKAGISLAKRLLRDNGSTL